MKKFINRKGVFISLSTVLLFIAAFVYYEKRSSSEVSYGVGLVIRQDLLQRVTIAGTIIPYRKTIVTAPFNGYVKKIFVKVGDSIKKGDPLVTFTQSLQTDDESHPIRSPLSGTVALVNKSEGEYMREIDQNEFIMKIEDKSKFFILGNIPEIDLTKVKVGMESIVKATAITHREYRGIIRELALSTKPDNNTSYWKNQVVEFPVRIEVIDFDEALKSGMSALIDVITLKKEKVLTLRHEYIHREGNTYFVIFENGSRKDIKVGIQNEEFYEIISGLEEGNKVKQVDFYNKNSE